MMGFSWEFTKHGVFFICGVSGGGVIDLIGTTMKSEKCFPCLNCSKI